VRDKGELIRFVLSPEGGVVFDPLQKLPGRGVYTCVSAACLAGAAKKRQFSRGFKREVTGADAETLLAQVKEKLAARIASYISLANKGGKVVSGSDSVLEQLKKGGGILFVAEDTSPDAAEKFRGVARANRVPAVQMFDKERLGALIGKEMRTVLVVLDSGFVGTIGSELEKYRNFLQEERE